MAHASNEIACHKRASSSPIEFPAFAGRSCEFEGLSNSVLDRVFPGVLISDMTSFGSPWRFPRDANESSPPSGMRAPRLLRKPRTGGLMIREHTRERTLRRPHSVRTVHAASASRSAQRSTALVAEGRRRKAHRLFARRGASSVSRAIAPLVHAYRMGVELVERFGCLRVRACIRDTCTYTPSAALTGSRLACTVSDVATDPVSCPSRVYENPKDNDAGHARWSPNIVGLALRVTWCKLSPIVPRRMVCEYHVMCELPLLCTCCTPDHPETPLRLRFCLRPQL